ncbi:MULTISPECIES: urease accessory protein UreE [Oceanobacillus]|uniref:Urease accessory protein UreE n=2 Tax=Oceanobacillus TaxID=182709 RepID=A0A0A1MU57_9BACI|nr:urease accessory protein UreE [Oceanobacillus oncorhynchi]MDM8101851.1 urease accessory protein UreE [Oceanobacillus oncorhynchi]UUI41686.1 urease accessory protein UreE [Oceanobacillus oncorhynchi]CEI83204.1 Urease accessory protein UreE [Oceanobacillus oncorhynchi]
MLVEKIEMNINDIEEAELAKLHKEKVYLDSADLLKRILRVKTDHGKDIGISLKERQALTKGDVLYKDTSNIIFIDVYQDDVIVIRPKDIHEMGVIAHQLGNRHLPAQFEADNMIVQYDYLVEELLKQLDISYQREERKLKEAFKHIGHSHD